MAARSLPGIFSAGSGHYGEQGNENENQGTPMKPPTDGKHSELQQSWPRQLQQMQCYLEWVAKETWGTGELRESTLNLKTRREEDNIMKNFK